MNETEVGYAGGAEALRQRPYSKCGIRAEGLACRRGERLIFEGLDLDLDNGEAIALTGRNGAGKSSLIAMLCGRLRPAAGTIRLIHCLPFWAKAMRMP